MLNVNNKTENHDAVDSRHKSETIKMMIAMETVTTDRCGMQIVRICVYLDNLISR